MKSYDLETTLLDTDVRVEFTAEFDHASRRWEPAENIAIEFSGRGLADMEKFAIHDLDESSRLMLLDAIADRLELAAPSEEESAASSYEEKGNRDYHDSAE